MGARQTQMTNVVDVLIEAADWDAVDALGLASRGLDAVLDAVGAGPPAAEVSVLFCDNTRIAELNAGFRSKNAPTNVLSWPDIERSSDVPGGMPNLSFGPDTPEFLGDVAIAYGVCAIEAVENDVQFGDHVYHLLVHGYLHLLGFDHENDLDAARMEQLETEILAKAGISDPYE
jgi:probable rRNA maturation factor